MGLGIRMCGTNSGAKKCKCPTVSVSVPSSLPSPLALLSAQAGISAPARSPVSDATPAPLQSAKNGNELIMEERRERSEEAHAACKYSTGHR